MSISAPAHTLIQISDVHIAVPPGAHDTAAVLERALGAVEESRLRPAALVVTGDLAEHGAPEEYRLLRSIMAPAAERIGAPVVYVAGNHDDRFSLRRHLLGSPADDGAGCGDAPFDHVVHVGDLRIVVLDSTVPGRGYGELRATQLSRLRAELATAAPAGTVLALHHPPLPSAAPLAASIKLQRREELAAVIAGTDVRMVLAGHTHVVSAGTLAGIPVWTGGAIATTIDGLAEGHLLRGLGTPTVSRIDLFVHDALATSVPIGADVLATVPDERMESMVAAFLAQLP